MRLPLLSIFLICLLTCAGCDKFKDKPPKEQKYSKLLISPVMVKPYLVERKEDCYLYDGVHYYELYIDGSLVYRDQLKTSNEDGEETTWQLSLGKHKIKVCADGFTCFEKEVNIVGNQQIENTSTQFIGIELTRNKQGGGEGGSAQKGVPCS